MHRRGFEARGTRLARDLGIAIVGPLDGMRPAQLHGAHVVAVVGARRLAAPAPSRRGHAGLVQPQRRCPHPRVSKLLDPPLRGFHRKPSRRPVRSGLSDGGLPTTLGAPD